VAPTISVVIPAFNAEEWIGFTLDSVLQQTDRQCLVEIIVVDDGSTDHTEREARSKLASSGIRHSIVRNLKPMGPGAARNRGWQHAGGTWIQFLDADDLLHPQKIDAQARVAAGAPVNVAVIFSPWTSLTYSNGAWVPTNGVFEPSIGTDQVLDLLRPSNFIATGSQLIRRAALERVGGYVESFRFVEDVDLLLRIAFDGGAFRPASSSQPLFFYRHRPDSASRSNDRAVIDGCVRNARTAERYWLDHDGLTAPRAKALTDVYYMAAHNFSEHDPAAFREMVKDLKRLSPHFMPDGPPALRMLTRVLGYQRAERCALHYRRLKRTVGIRAGA
jgi:glycosyltransferase involved in cell wall biosynthesis